MFVSESVIIEVCTVMRVSNTVILEIYLRKMIKILARTRYVQKANDVQTSEVLAFPFRPPYSAPPTFLDVSANHQDHL